MFKSKFSPKTWAIISFVAAGIGITLAFQNCNSSSTKFASSSSAQSAAEITEQKVDGCQPSLQSWQVGNISCSAETLFIAEGQSEQLLIDATLPTTGQATFRCVNGEILQVSEFPKTCVMANAGTTTHGACGSFHNTQIQPTQMVTPTASQICLAGSPQPIMGLGPWTWNCAGTFGGTTAYCSASMGPQSTAGRCGGSNGQTFPSAPTSALCIDGNPTSVQGAGPWSWTCVGLNGGTTATCTAQKTSSGGGGQSPQCGAATTGSRGYISLSQFTANDYCYTGGSEVRNLSGTGPWTWFCVNPSTNEQSSLCSAGVASTESCGPTSTILTGTKSCVLKYNQTQKECGACIPSVCNTGYQKTGSPASCSPLYAGTCSIPAGKILIMASSTHASRQCEATIGATTLSNGQQTTVSCSNTSGMSASMKIKCVHTSDTRATDNAGAPFTVKQLFNLHGRINTNDNDDMNWEYATFGIRSSGYILEANIMRTISFNASCRPDPLLVTGNFYLNGTTPVRSGGAIVSKCLNDNDGNGPYLVYIKCDGIPAYNDTYGTWEMIWSKRASGITGGCSVDGKNGTYSWQTATAP